LNIFWKTVIFILVILYIISPIDALPGLSPISLLDDAFLTGLLIYYLKNGRLPGFMSVFSRVFSRKKGKTQGRHEDTSEYENSRKETGYKKKENALANDPYEVLGVKPGDSKKVIQKAYREAVQQYHPDKASHLGKEIQELANEKFVEIQKAYDVLMND